ncbi:hypothetical protein WMY93_018316 [Mugilogobius chulae]|uniref:Uncharacterized protein n=1 Tax=Mugilogobius chulae TaxID=88201 RepID=A0AAW0NTK7_9GOBI
MCDYRRPNTLRREDQRQSNYLEETVMAKGRVDTRAISTPKATVNVNLTFDEVSAILSDKDTNVCFSRQVSYSDSESSLLLTPYLNILYIHTKWNLFYLLIFIKIYFRFLKKTSRAKQWNVQSPLRKKNPARKSAPVQDA